MALEDYELSTENAKPVYLYAFSLGARVWRYAASASDVLTADGYVWAASAISHDGVKQTGEAASDALTLTAPITIAPAQLFLVSPPGGQVLLRIFQKDLADPEVYAIYAGEVTQVNFPDPGVADITCETLSVSLRREGLRFGWQRACPYAVYDPLTCKVNKAAYAVTTTITAISGFDVTVAATLTANVYAGGFLQLSHPVKGVENLGLEAQTGNTVRIFGAMQDLSVGQVVTLYRGCARTPAACQQFGNYANYGGVPNMPGTSPFDGNNPFY